MVLMMKLHLLEYVILETYGVKDQISDLATGYILWFAKNSFINKTFSQNLLLF